MNIGAFMTCRFPGDFDIQVDYKLLSVPLPPQILQFFNTVEFTGGSFLGGTHGMFVFNPGFGDPGVSTNFPGTNTFQADTSLTGTMRMARTTIAGSGHHHGLQKCRRQLGRVANERPICLRRDSRQPQCVHELVPVPEYDREGRLRQLPPQQRRDQLPNLVDR